MKEASKEGRINWWMAVTHSGKEDSFQYFILFLVSKVRSVMELLLCSFLYIYIYNLFMGSGGDLSCLLQQFTGKKRMERISKG